MITIPISPELMHHPKTRALARLTGLPRADTWPKLILFWSYAAQYYPAGDVTDLKDDPAELAFALEFPSPDQAVSFFSGMLEVGFLDRDAAGRLTIHDWFTQGPGRLLRKQAADRARKRLRAVSAEFPRNIQTACRNPTSDPRNPIPEKPCNISKVPIPYTRHGAARGARRRDAAPLRGILYQAFPIPWKAIRAVLENRARFHHRFIVDFWLANLENDRQRLARLLKVLKKEKPAAAATDSLPAEEQLYLRKAAIS